MLAFEQGSLDPDRFNGRLEELAQDSKTALRSSSCGHELLGERNWYLPRWLEWLPRLTVEGPGVPGVPGVPGWAAVQAAERESILVGGPPLTTLLHEPVGTSGA